MIEPKPRKLSYRGARKKGSRFEYVIRDELVKIGVLARRVPMSGALAHLKGDVSEFNVAQKHIHEAKNHEKLALPEWWRQAAEQVQNGETPVLHFRGNYHDSHTVMRATDFDDMVYDYEQKRPELTLNLIDFPPRKDFWKWQTLNKTLGRDVYLWNLSGKTVEKIDMRGNKKVIHHPDEQLIIMNLELYLLIRKHSVTLV